MLSNEFERKFNFPSSDKFHTRSHSDFSMFTDSIHYESNLCAVENGDTPHIHGDSLRQKINTINLKYDSHVLPVNNCTEHSEGKKIKYSSAESNY